MRILHIHTDPKFLFTTVLSRLEPFINDTLFIGNPQNDERIKFQVKNDFLGLRKVINIANNYELIILYDLDFAKSYIVNRINKNIIVMWRFFGYELYSQMSEVILSEKTKQALLANPTRKSLYSIIAGFTHKYILRYRRNHILEFDSALKRVQYFLGLSREEYDFLLEYYELPEFVQMPYHINTQLIYQKKMGNKILLGNNKSSYNNHIDMFDIMENYPEIEKFTFLNYGSDSPFYFYLLDRISKIPNFKPIIEYLNKSEYELFYKELDAFVLNGYRQMAVGNIFTAIQFGVKIYMNRKNKYYDFLTNNSFIIFDINNLDVDLKMNNITLPENQAIENVNALKDLTIKYNTEDFILKVKHITAQLLTLR